MRRVPRPGQTSPTSSEIVQTNDLPKRDIEADDSRATKRAQKPQYDGAVTMLRALIAAFILLMLLAIGHGDAGKALKALGWKRKNRVALLTVATHMNRLAETSDSESEYGASKTAFSYPFSIDNKARYCELHQYDLNVDVHTDDSLEEEDYLNTLQEKGPQGEGIMKRSSRFRKLKLIKNMWDSYDWLIWMDIDALFLDPSTDVLSLLDTNADIHFTLEEGGNGMNRVNTGFFAIKTTKFAYEFFERAWYINDCGRGESDQRSINYILGIVNSDDQFCDQEKASKEWADLYTKYGGGQSTSTSTSTSTSSSLSKTILSGGSSGIPSPGDQDSHIRFYKKPLLNSFPKDVSKFLMPVEKYALPSKQGDERGASLVVHFAGQYGGARSLDGKLPIGMLVQYLHLLARYHSIFLDRVKTAQIKEQIKRGILSEDSSSSHPFHDDRKINTKQQQQHSKEGRHKPGSSASISGHVGHGPKTLQDAIIDHGHEWTRDIDDVLLRIKNLESYIDNTCLSKLRQYYNPIVDMDTGISYYEPPHLVKPDLNNLNTISKNEYWKYIDVYGNAKIDLEKTCDYSNVLSMARGHLADILPPPHQEIHDSHRWPRSLLCAAPMGVTGLESKLNSSRLWLETRKASTLTKLLHGAPYFEDDEYSVGGPFSMQEGNGEGGGDDDGGGGDDGSALLALGLVEKVKPLSHIDPLHHGTPLGPSLYATIDIGTASSDIDNQKDNGKSNSHASENDQEEGEDDDESSEESESEGEGGSSNQEEIELELGAATKGKLLIAVSECSFLDPSSNTIIESTFAFSANPDRQRHSPKSAVYTFDSKKLNKLKSASTLTSSTSTSTSSSLLLSYPGVVYLPPISKRALSVLHHVTGQLKKNSKQKLGMIHSQTNKNDDDDNNDDNDDNEKPEMKSAKLMFWSYTAPLLLKLYKELPSNIKIILPKFKSDYEEKEFEKGINILKIPSERIISSSGSSSIYYADILLSLHTLESLDTISLSQLYMLRNAITSSQSSSQPSSGQYDPYDDLVIIITERPSDALDGYGTKVSDWFTVEQSLRNALPEERVVRFDHGFDPDDYAGLEFFKRAKMIIVSAGVVPSLLMSMYSSEEIPVIELVGLNSYNAVKGGDGASRGGGYHMGGHEGWDWTKQVCNGFGLPRFTVKSKRISEKGTSLFDSKVIADVARTALSYHHDLEIEEEFDDKDDKELFSSGHDQEGTGGNGGYENTDKKKNESKDKRRRNNKDRDDQEELVDDDWHKEDLEKDKSEENDGYDLTRDDVRQEDKNKEEDLDLFDDNARNEQLDLKMPKGVYALINKFEKQYYKEEKNEEQEKDVKSSKSKKNLKKKTLQVEMGLHDRDRFGELFQRLSVSQDTSVQKRMRESSHAISVGAENGDFSLQVLRSWPSLKEYSIHDSFISSPVLDDSQDDRIHSSSSLKIQDPRYNKIQTVLKNYIHSGKVNIINNNNNNNNNNEKEDTLSKEGNTKKAMFIYLDDEDHTFLNTYNKIIKYYDDYLIYGGILGGHDFTLAHEGVPKAIIYFCLKNNLKLYITDIMRPRSDVMGNILPPCCPSWYIYKPLPSSSPSSNHQDDNKDDDRDDDLIMSHHESSLTSSSSSFEQTALSIIKHMNAGSFEEEEEEEEENDKENKQGDDDLA